MALLLAMHLIFFAPTAFASAQEKQELSNVAPENCLFYASWGTLDDFAAITGQNERWIAQAKIQASWIKMQFQFIDEGMSDVQFTQPHEKALAGLARQFAKLALTNPTAIFAEDADKLVDLRGGCVIVLEPESLRQIEEALAVVQNQLPENWNPREIKIDDYRYLTFTPTSSAVEVAVGIHSPFAIFGFGPESIRIIEQRMRAPEPNWLSDMKSRLGLERELWVSRLSVRNFVRLAEQTPWWTDSRAAELNEILRLNEALKLDAIIAMETACGVDEQGYITRHHLTFADGKLVGLASVLDSSIRSDSKLTDSIISENCIIGSQLSTSNAYELIAAILKLYGRSLEDISGWSQDAFGLRIKDDFVDYLDGSVFVRGNFDVADPLSDWVIELGLSDEVSIDDSVQKLNELLPKFFERESIDSKFVVNEVNGIKTYSIERVQDVSLKPIPTWCLRDGRLCIASTARALSQVPVNTESPHADDARSKNLSAWAMQAGYSAPSAVSRFEMSQVIVLLKTIASLRGMRAVHSTLAEFVPYEITDSGLETSDLLVFRSTNGIEIFGRQEVPNSTTIGSLLSAGMFSFPLLHWAELELASKKQMRLIVVGMHNYHDAHKAFPARFNQDKEGRPLLSWRVHLLPFMGEKDLYEQFHLDEPWDSEHNKTLIPKMPTLLVHPRMNLEPGYTSYVALVGTNTVWRQPSDDDQSPKGITLEQIAFADGTSMTGTLAEVNADHAVVWTQPEDIDIENEETLGKLTGIWRQGFLLAMSDASVRTLRSDLDVSKLSNLFRFNDGQPPMATLKTWWIMR